MSAEKLSQPANNESLEAERDLLLHIQASHQSILEQRGMLATALSTIPGYSPDASSGLVRAFMTKKTATYDLDNPPDRIHIVPAIRICSITLGENSKFQDDRRLYHDVRVADIDAEGVMIPEPGFSYDDVQEAIHMLKGLKEDRDVGFLTHLNSHFTAIRDPEDITTSHPSSNF